MTDDQIKQMANRFLMWKLPEHFQPDAGIKFEPSYSEEPMRSRHWPIGTNLFGADQAEEMVRHMLEGIEETRTTASHADELAKRDALLWEARDELARYAGIDGNLTSREVVMGILDRIAALIAKPDPLLEAAQAVAVAQAKAMGVELKGYAIEQEWADNMRAELRKRGIELGTKP